jgi:hypothetical protein
MWKRFKDNSQDYFYLCHSNFDAVAYVPKTNIYFHGFGIYGSYDGKDITYKVKYAFNEDEASEEFEITKPNSERDPEARW